MVEEEEEEGTEGFMDRPKAAAVEDAVGRLNPKSTGTTQHSPPLYMQADSVHSSEDGSIPSPDSAVMRVEDTLSASKLTLERLSLKALTPLRPGFGTRGVTVTLWANYVRIIADPDLALYRYALSVSPNATGRKLNQIIRLLLKTPELAELQQDMVSDFKSTCVSRQRLPEDDMTIAITYRADGEDEPRQGATSYNVRILYTNTLSVGELTEYLTSTDLAASYDNKQPLIQALNIFLNHYAKSTDETGTIGSARTFSLRPDAPKWDLGGGLTAIRGFFASVRAATCRILVNVNVANAAFYNDGPLDQLIVAFDSQRRGGKTRLASFLKRVQVRTIHLPEKKNKTGEVIYRVKTIVGLATPNDGHGLPHPPRVREFGAGPKLVEFWMDSDPLAKPNPATKASGSRVKEKKKDGKGGGPGVPAASSSSRGRYISVYDFFLNSEWSRVCPSHTYPYLAYTSQRMAELSKSRNSLLSMPERGRNQCTFLQRSASSCPARAPIPSWTPAKPSK